MRSVGQLRPGGVARQGTWSWPVAGVCAAVAAVFLLLGWTFKARCFGPVFDENGVSGPDLFRRWTQDVCYSDLQSLWAGRRLYEHAPPYSGSYSAGAGLSGGTLEYPVLSGLLLWMAALPADTDQVFVALSAGLLVPCGLFTAAALGRLAGWRALWFAAAPGLVLYTVLNCDLWAVAATTGAIWLMIGAEGPRRQKYLLWAAVLVGVGGALKLYPLMFALPMALAATSERGSPGALVPPRRQWGVGLRFGAVAAGTFVAFNLPFALTNFGGWWAAFQFQWERPIDNATNSIWYWGLRPYSESSDETLQGLMASASTVATATSLMVVVGVGWWRGRGGTYPWMQVSAAMLCAYMIFNKVNSPQYVLWLCPFLVVLRVGAPWILAYFLTNAMVGIGFLRRVATGSSSIEDSVWPQILILGVWGQTFALAGLCVVSLRSASVVDRRDAGGSVSSDLVARDGDEPDVRRLDDDPRRPVRG